MENKESPLKLEALVTVRGVATTTSLVDNKELESLVDADIMGFDEYFQSLGNEPVVKSERAIIKTYLHWKLKGATHGEAAGR